MDLQFNDLLLKRFFFAELTISKSSSTSNNVGCYFF
jgi:hypothetical protein